MMTKTFLEEDIIDKEREDWEERLIKEVILTIF